MCASDSSEKPTTQEVCVTWSNRHPLEDWVCWLVVLFQDFIYKDAHECAWLRLMRTTGRSEGAGTAGIGVAGSCEPLDTDAWNRTQALYKSSKCG